MTGISDVLKNSQELLNYSKYKIFGLKNDVCNSPPLPYRPDPRPSIKLNEQNIINHNLENNFEIINYKWAVLCPVTSRGNNNYNEIKSQLKESALSLVNSIPNEYKNLTTVFIGYDMKDPLYDPKYTKDKQKEEEEDKIKIRNEIKEYFKGIRVEFVGFPPAFHGSICWIWNDLAKIAVDKGNDFFVLLGDDVIINGNWQDEVLHNFKYYNNKFPFGFGCVAIQDRSFDVFPTFPVINRLHFKIFGKLFPDEFKNQHGDPYLFEIYRRFGCSRFTQNSFLENKIGGENDARYIKKNNFHWQGDILTKSIDNLEHWLHNLNINFTQIPCIDVIVPTYRCNLSILQNICNLSSEKENIDIHKIIIVDNPDIKNLEEIKKLQSYKYHRTIRVYVMKSNQGASMARNTGLAQSFSDHAILLDDDIFPKNNLIDAYVSAIERYPDAKIYIGNTIFPKANTYIEKSIIASRICYFYGISTQIKNPPWGVTANMCVKSRTNNKIWFLTNYPKTGGGEDVDFCLRYKSKNEDICSVKNAIVTHPYWSNPFKQISGWASGDVLCLDFFPNKSFYCCPNWCESILFYLLYQIYNFQKIDINVYFLIILVHFGFRFPTYFTKSYEDERKSYNYNIFTSFIVGLIATLYPTIQDFVRIISKIRRLRLRQLCCHFDWMDGQKDHIPASKLASIFEFTCLVFCLLTYFCNNYYLKNLLILVSTIIYFTWIKFQYNIISVNIYNKPKDSDLIFNKSTTPFVILATQRTGSNMLCGYLNSHPEILMHNELFNEVGIFSPNKDILQSDINPLQNRDSDPTNFLQKAFLLNNFNQKAIGFKLFPEHINKSDDHLKLFKSILNDPRIHKIILYRENKLEVCTSMLKSSITSKYTHHNYDWLKLKISPSEFQKFIESYDNYYEWLKLQTKNTPVHFVTYEEIIEDNNESLNKIAKFINVNESDNWNTSFNKQSNLSIKNIITNYDDLKYCFKNYSI